jgi:hypothetical protein
LSWQEDSYNCSTNWERDNLTELEDDDSNHEEDLDNNDNPFDGTSSNMVVDKDSKEPVKVTYPEILSLCTILVCMAANDKKEKRKVHSIVQGKMTCHKKETAFVVHFDDHLPVSSQVNQENNTNACQPARVIMQSVTNSSKVCLKNVSKRAYFQEGGKEGNARA